MDDISSDLKCPVCSALLKNAVQLPCCFVTACRSCAYKKLMGTGRHCWVGSSSTCSQPLQLDQLVPAVEVRKKVEEFKKGKNETSLPDTNSEVIKKIARRDPRLKAKTNKLILCEKIDDETDDLGTNTEEALVQKSQEMTVLSGTIKQEAVEATVKQEPATCYDNEINTDGYQEYSEITNLIEPRGELEFGLKREIKAEQDSGFENALWNPFSSQNAESEEASFDRHLSTCILCGKHGHELSNCPQLKCKGCGESGHAVFNCPVDRLSKSDRNSIDSVPFSPKKEPPDDTASIATSKNDSVPATTSNSSAEPPSSGYFSGNARDASFFGKLRWFSEEKTRGVIECFENGESKACFVSGYDVKCGAETGDLVEFVLGQDSQYGKAAKKVKLVEKGLPQTEHEQLKNQERLKRRLAMTAEMMEGSSGKKVKQENVIDVKAEMTSMSSWSDIAEDDSDEDDKMEENKEAIKPNLALLSDAQLNIKAENLSQLTLEGLPSVSEDFSTTGEELDYENCICEKGILVRCKVCPFYYLESVQEYNIIENESATLVARIYAEKNQVKRNMSFVRHLPFPFSRPKGPEFQVLETLGHKSLVKKVTPVFYDDHVFVTVVNSGETDDQVTIKPGDILGICQEHFSKDSEVSPHFMYEPPDRQESENIPVFARKGDFTLDENSIACGFGVIGSEDVNYKHCLVGLELVPTLAKHFMIVKNELTVQVRRNVWLEIEAKDKEQFEEYIPQNGIIAYAKSVMKEEYIRNMFCILEAGKQKGALTSKIEQLLMKNREKSDSEEEMDNDTDYEKSVMEVKEEDIKDEIKTEEPDESAYDEMLAQIDFDMITNKVETKNELPVFDPNDFSSDKPFKAFVNEDILCIPPNGNAISSLRIKEEHFKIIPTVGKKALIQNNEEFKYYNNCYNIEEQVGPIYYEKCKFSRRPVPCVKVCIQNPRDQVAYLPRSACIALVKLQTKSRVKSKRPNVPTPEPPKQPISQTPQRPKKVYSPIKSLDKSQRKYLRIWNNLLEQNPFQKSLRVEKKFPYFRPNKKPKVPYGLKDFAELTMRVGLDQNCKPIKVLDKVNGVYTCTICDEVILCKFSLQDHWYGKKHKQNMRLVQVIAGLPERLYMNRPVVKELLDQFNAGPLLGLDYIFEVLHGEQEPSYNCALCNIDSNMKYLMQHVTSLSHILNFLKEFFPSAWAKFSPRPDPINWIESDVSNLDAIVRKIEAVHGRKNPSIVENNVKLEEAIDKIPIDAYHSRRAELDLFFKSLESSSEPAGGSEVFPTGAIVSRPAIMTDSIHIPPSTAKIAVLKVMNVPNSQMLEGRFVQATKNPSKISECEVKAGASRVWLESTGAYIQATLYNPLVSSSITARKNSDLIIIKWRN